MSRSSAAPLPEPERRADEPKPLVDAMGGSMPPLHGDPSRAEVEEPVHRREPRRRPALQVAAIAAVVVLVLLVVVLIL